MSDLEALFTAAERIEMDRRARAIMHLAHAVQMQWEDPCGLRDRHVGIMIKIASHAGLSDDEIRQTIDDTRRECAQRG